MSVNTGAKRWNVSINTKAARWNMSINTRATRAGALATVDTTGCESRTAEGRRSIIVAVVVRIRAAVVVSRRLFAHVGV